MAKNVTGHTRKHAYEAIKVVVQAILSDKNAISYSDLATHLPIQDNSGRGLGHILVEAAKICAENKFPNISSIVVTQESIREGCPFPSEKSFSGGSWAKTGMKREDVKAEQNKVLTFDWKSILWSELGKYYSDTLLFRTQSRTFAP